MTGWNDFCVAVAGASAALSGLIFVGLSINITRLLEIPAVLLRVGVALVLLVSVLSISALLLIPDQGARTDGLEILAIGTVVWGLATWRACRSFGRWMRPICSMRSSPSSLVNSSQFR